jgi:hypothetical protein
MPLAAPSKKAPRTQFSQPLLAPGKMIEFLIGRSLHLIFDFRIASDSSMALIQALRGDFARMIDPHQACRMRLLAGRHRFVLNPSGGVVPGSVSRRSGSRLEKVVDARDQPVYRCQLSLRHRRHYSRPVARLRCSVNRRFRIYFAAFVAIVPTMNEIRIDI